MFGPDSIPWYAVKFWIQRNVPIGKPPIGGPPTTYADWTSADWELCRSQKLGIVPISVGIVPILIFLDSAGLGGPGQQLVCTLTISIHHLGQG